MMNLHAIKEATNQVLLERRNSYDKRIRFNDKHKPVQLLAASSLNHHSSPKLPGLGFSQGLQMNSKLHWHMTMQTRKPQALS
jgi:hypothetical protein